jgi:hypothetical protein
MCQVRKKFVKQVVHDKLGSTLCLAGQRNATIQSNLPLLLKDSTEKRKYWRQQTKSSNKGARSLGVYADFKTRCDGTRNWTAMFRIRCQKALIGAAKRSG